MPQQTFTAGQVLTAAQLTDLQANSGLQFIKSQTIGSGVSSVTVSGAFSTTYDNYKIIVSGGVASATNTLNMTLGSTTSGYGRMQALYAYNTTTLTVDSSDFASPFVVVAGGSTNGLSGTIEIFNPFTASATSFYASSQGLIASGAFAVRTLFGALLNTTSYTAFTLTTSTGTITGGTISVYGYAK
ncbi:hypothetical protein UFOVP718_3 [uncultured Caudovirales phage]|uniref:Uncharacterized protein n=1 Tax=uncultured Caudovirales phage TaxID=2100421 RepID=A0A6J5NM10_9CAUD|nr:hypothetical protein UFOVP718_3 [uncultured Caudovirales phage]